MVVVEDAVLAGDGHAAVVVAGAGWDDANGLYAATGKTWHGAPVFENDRKCLLSREPHKSQRTGQASYGWILGQDRKPLYAVQSDALAPPAAGWRQFSGTLPLPQLRGLGSTAEAALAAAEAFKEQGNTLFAAQLYKEAGEAWTRALGLEGLLGEGHPVAVALYSNRAEARLRQGSWEAALGDAQAALARRPGHDKALLRGAVAARELRRYPLALELVQRCLDEHPHSPQALELALDLDRRLEEERQDLPELARAAYAKLQDSLRRESEEADLRGLPRELADKVASGRRGLKAFAGYGVKREEQATSGPALPLTKLPYHSMGLPPEQVELMDNFFQEMRDQKAQKESMAKEEREQYERVKERWRERAEEGVVTGRLEPLEEILHSKAIEEIVKDVGESKGQLLKSKAEALKVPDTLGPSLQTAVQLSKKDADEIDLLFARFEAKPQPREEPTGRAGRSATRGELDREEAEERRVLAEGALAHLRELGCTRGGEPTKFDQAAGEVYCWWALPPSISGRDVKVKVSQGGTHLTITVRNVVIFDRALFHIVRAGDVVWSVGGGELHLTLTKAERSRLWDQLGRVGEVRRDEAGEVIPASVPEPLSAKSRIDMFRAMVSGDDGQQRNYDDLDPEGKRLVEAMRRYEHARATGDQEGLALAEMDLEEFGRLVV